MRGVFSTLVVGNYKQYFTVSICINIKILKPFLSILGPRPFVNIKYRTRRFIGEELILAIGDFSENLPILNLPTLILCHKDTPTKLHTYAILLRMRGWNGHDTEWLLIVNFKIVRIPPI